MGTTTRNSKNRFSTRSLTQKELLEWFRYDPETGLFFWAKRPKIGGGSAKVGDVAGSINSKNNRRVLWLRRKRIYAGRAAWVMSNGDIADDVLVDHIDGDTLNDKLINLRIAGAAQNTWNRIGSSAMMKGVSKGTRGRFKARISTPAGKINLGTWDTEAEAHAAYMGAAAIIHGEFWLGNRPAYQRAAADAVTKRRA